MVIAGWSVRGGSGTTVVCSALASTWSRSVPTVLVDLCGDAPALFGRPTTTRPGLMHWCMAHQSVGPESIGDLVDTQGGKGTPDLLHAGQPLHRGEGGSEPDAAASRGEEQRLEKRLQQGLQWLAQTYDRVVIDLGTRTDARAEALLRASTASLLVMRPCTITMREAIRSKRAVVGTVLVGSGSGSLRADDVEALLGVPVFAHIPTVRSIPAAVDAGTFGQRLPRQLRAPMQAVHTGLGTAP